MFMLSWQHQQIVYYKLADRHRHDDTLPHPVYQGKDFKHLALSAVLSLGMGILILGTVALAYWPTYEFTKETMRGGRSELTQKTRKYETKGGLIRTMPSSGVTEKPRP